ncbi:cache domain-containing sensor histidine kinase [Tissierella praeacuta]|uniref:cache domain-containing sensor histidine kinase n=1 Tax=Tissierella praeacuta TaxID=43131 RepID=UPI001C1218B3|nr:histidine kinase [Tissierella praeacuta]MBU5255937.1 histidine kinase [Tissierella praeacuta]
MSRIQNKITLYVVASLFILFILLLWNIDMEMDKSVIPLSKNLTQQMVDARSEQISNWIEERIIEIKLIGEQIGYLNMSLDESLEYMRFSLGNNNIYESLGIIDEDGIAWITDNSSFSIANRDYYKKINEEGTPFVISNPLKSKSNKVDIIIILYRLPKDIEQKFSYISAAVPIETIKDIASRIQLYDGGSKIYDISGNPIGGEDSGIDNKVDIIEFSSSIEKSPGWTIVFKVPEYRLYEGAKRLKGSAIKIGLLIGVVLIVLLTLFSSSIVRPICRMQELMKKVENGDLKIRFKDYRNDEIGDLQKSFDQMLDRLYTVKYEKKEMELRLLQEQVNPHFLYNTLDTIRWSAIEYDAMEVVELIEALSNYFRIGLSKGEKFIRVSEEISHIKSYIQIYQARFEEELDYKIICNESLLGYRVIRVLLQPLVENAIYHGNKYNKNPRFKIIVNIFKEGNELIMEVRNNGENIEVNRLKIIRKILSGKEKNGDKIGFGLYSVNQRIKLAFGENYGLDIKNEKDWVISRINCPIIMEDKYVEDIDC